MTGGPKTETKEGVRGQASSHAGRVCFPWQFETGRRFLLVAASLIGGLFLLEFPAFIGIVDYQGIISPYKRWFSRGITTDPELFHIRRPHTRDSGSAWGGDIVAGLQVPRSDLSFYRWDLRYDENGLRNERDLDRAGIIVIGDSFVEALTVPDEALLTSILARLRKEVVANLSQSKFGPQQELVLLRRYGLRLRPHTVVWMFSEGSDLGDTLGYQQFLHKRASLWQTFRKRSFTQNLLELLRFLWKKPAAAPGNQFSGVLRLPDGRTYNQYFLQGVTGDLKGKDLEAIDQAAGIIAEANRLAATQGASFVVGFVPAAFRILHAFCQFPPESQVGRWKVNDMPERLQKALQAKAPEAGFLDLTPALTEAARQGTIPYYRDDEHWSEAGHRVAADALNRYLQQFDSR